MTSPRGLLLAALRSGSGKTTVTLGLLRALARRGIAVGGAKCGPDYIDPAFHRAASGRDSLNLDSWAMEPALIGHLAGLAASGLDLLVVEALMGLFDGVPGAPGRTGASAEIAAALRLPVVVIADVSGQSQSAAASALGVRAYAPEMDFAGVILNRVGSERHTRLVAAAMADHGIEVFGAIPRSPDVVLPERHLGLVQASETADLAAILDRMADLVEAHVAVDRLIERAGALAPLAASPAALPPPPGQRIAVAHDAAFGFLYPHLLTGWRAAGAEIALFSPLADQAPVSDADACWLPGGYPELHAERLAGNRGFLDGLRRFAETRPVHGECGGYMVLGRVLTDAAGRDHAMAGLLDVSTSFAKRRMHLGYRSAETLADGPFGPAGTRLRGHEFHYATITDPGRDEPFALAGDAHGGPIAPTGSRRGRVSGTFFHVIARG